MDIYETILNTPDYKFEDAHVDALNSAAGSLKNTGLRFAVYLQLLYNLKNSKYNEEYLNKINDSFLVLAYAILNLNVKQNLKNRLYHYCLLFNPQEHKITYDDLKLMDANKLNDLLVSYSCDSKIQFEESFFLNTVFTACKWFSKINILNFFASTELYQSILNCDDCIIENKKVVSFIAEEYCKIYTSKMQKADELRFLKLNLQTNDLLKEYTEKILEFKKIKPVIEQLEDDETYTYITLPNDHTYIEKDEVDIYLKHGPFIIDRLTKNGETLNTVPWSERLSKNKSVQLSKATGKEIKANSLSTCVIMYEVENCGIYTLNNIKLVVNKKRKSDSDKTVKKPRVE